LTQQSNMAIERYERLKSEEMLYPDKERPKPAGSYEEHKIQVFLFFIISKPTHSMIRTDDIEIYLRLILSSHKKSRTINRLVKTIGYLPIYKGNDIWLDSRYNMINVADQIYNNHEYFSNKRNKKGKIQKKQDCN